MVKLRKKLCFEQNNILVLIVIKYTTTRLEISVTGEKLKNFKNNLDMCQ